MQSKNTFLKFKTDKLDRLTKKYHPCGGESLGRQPKKKIKGIAQKPEDKQLSKVQTR